MRFTFQLLSSEALLVVTHPRSDDRRGCFQVLDRMGGLIGRVVSSSSKSLGFLDRDVSKFPGLFTSRVIVHHHHINPTIYLEN